MKQGNHYLIFSLEGQYIALPLDNVAKVVRAVKITPVPEAPPLVRGIIDLGGDMIPVLDIRAKLKMPKREPSVDERIIIFSYQDFKVSFFVDEVIDVVELDSAEIQLQETIMPGEENLLLGVSKYQTGYVLHYQCEFFSQGICFDHTLHRLPFSDLEGK